MLLETGSKVLVEASPHDRIWGIGMAQEHADAPYPERWLGENRLGRILMEVRDELSKELKPKWFELVVDLLACPIPHVTIWTTDDFILTAVLGLFLVF